jgi:hypothetical protein
MAETQTVPWTRILDRLAGPEPPTVLCVDRGRGAPGQAQPLPQWHDPESEVLSPQVLAS